jgi:peroxiredoxin
MVIDRLLELDCQLLGISVDSVPCHRAWAKSLGGLAYPLMSDFWPHGRVAKLYGILTEKGYSERVVFLIDKKGFIRWIDHVELAKTPDNDALIAQLELLQDE